MLTRKGTIMFGARMVITPTAGVVAGLIDNFVRRHQCRSAKIARRGGLGSGRRQGVITMRLTVDALCASRGGEPVISELSFVVEGGAALVVTGENGTGKSTLLRVIAGLLEADGGTVRLEGGPADAEHAGEAMHYLGHKNAMKRELTVRENLTFWADFTQSSSPGLPAMTIEAAAGAVGLETVLHLPFGYLSAGQQRRIAMTKLLVAHRPVWILDEPTAALDRASERLFATMVNRHLERGGLAVIATHQPLDITPVTHLSLDGRAQNDARDEAWHA
jgi:heme exporter protein A